MPRTFGTTNIMAYASAPPVGAVGDEYYNTTNKSLYISDGTQWNQIQAGGGGGGAPYAPVTGTPPNASSPVISPPTGLLWVDTATTPSWAPVAGPAGPTGPTGPQGPTGPGMVDYGVTAADLNTLTASGTYVASDANTNAPPLLVGQYFLTVNRSSAGSFIQQQATLITSGAYIATRFYSGGSWGGWKSPAAGLLWTSGASPAYSGATGNLWTVASGAGEVAGRKYRITIWLTIQNNTGAAQSYVYLVVTTNNSTVTFPGAGGRMFWIGANINAGQSIYGAMSWLYTATATMVPTFTVGFNGAGTPWVVNANGMAIVHEDVGY